MHTFSVQTSKRRHIIDITKQVQSVIASSGCTNGLVMISALHSTCAICIGEVVQNVDQDFVAFLNAVVPQLDFKHVHPPDHPKDGSDETTDGPLHPSSHILAIMLGPSKCMGVVDMNLVRGEWQSIMLVELEGPRERKIAVQVIGENARDASALAGLAFDAAR